MKYIRGPINSRRLGRSLGINLLPAKICNFDCVYCEIGLTSQLTVERREYTPTHEIIKAVKTFLHDPPSAVDVLTITAFGEPTLHSGIGTIIRRIKDVAKQPVAVLTNGSLLHLPEVREDLAAADIVIPSLDAARPESFRLINRPAPEVQLAEIINGLALFSQQYTGALWLEILLAEGINDSPADLAALATVLGRIRAARIQLNTVVRQPLEKFARPLSKERLQEIAAFLGNGVEVLTRGENASADASCCRPPTACVGPLGAVTAKICAAG